jgi:predicted amidohydrolase
MGADLILIPTANTTDEPMEMFEWEIRVQAFQNSTAIAMCNRVGVEGEMTFSGESLVVSADGNVIKKADSLEGILYVEVDLTESMRIRNGKSYTNLRRTEWYQ